MLQQQSTGFQPINLVPRPPHLQGLYGNQQPGNQFGYGKGAGPRSIKVVGATQNAGSSSYIPTEPQINRFVSNGLVDLRACYKEVLRRAEQLECEYFESVCSFERFKSLATECGNVNQQTAREAITILQGEMHGYYVNARRVDYGPEIKGLDFAVDGLGQFENITHANTKNGVGSVIKITENQDPNIRQQGRSIGKKSVWQKKFWSNRARTSELPGINSDAYLPKSVNATITVMDCFDVPTFEKSIIQEGFNSGSKNDTNCVFLNNVTNI
jgi:hypothetical protein